MSSPTLIMLQTDRVTHDTYRQTYTDTDSGSDSLWLFANSC